MSATAGVYVVAVAPVIATQLAMSPGALQRRHEYVIVGAGAPSHVPAVKDTTWSTTGFAFTETICGVTRSLGAISATVGVASEFCETEPAAVVALTITRSTLPKYVDRTV